MEKFVIEGGVALSGTFVPAGNKNGALPILAACLLTEDEVILRNVPGIRDVEAMTLLLEGLGARVEWMGSGELLVDASGVHPFPLSRDVRPLKTGSDGPRRPRRASLRLGSLQVGQNCR